MRRIVQSWPGVGCALAFALVGSGCASGRAIARPSPFPGAAPAVSPAAPTPASGGALPTALDLVRTANEFRGIGYRLGGDTPDEGFDCSGFVHYLFGLYHIGVPRTVAEQYTAGAPVRPSRIEAGDLIFFTTIAPGASHVGLAIDRVSFIHAPSDGGSVRIDRLDAPYWRDRIVGVRRLLPE